MPLVSKDGVEFFEIPSEHDAKTGKDKSLLEAQDKGYTEYVDVTKDGKDKFTIPASELRAAIEKGYNTVQLQESLQELAEEEPTTASEAYVKGAKQGAVFDFADELQAGFRKLTGMPTQVADNLQRVERMREEKLAEEQTVAYVAGQITGGILQGLATAGVGMKLAAGTKLAQVAAKSPVLTGIANATFEGAISAVGAGEEGNRFDVKRLASAAGVGAATAGVLTGVGKGARAAYKTTKTLASKTDGGITVVGQVEKNLQGSAGDDTKLVTILEKWAKDEKLTKAESRLLGQRLFDRGVDEDTAQKQGLKMLVKDAAKVLGSPPKGTKAADFLKNKIITEENGAQKAVSNLRSLEEYTNVLHTDGNIDRAEKAAGNDGWTRSLWGFFSSARGIVESVSDRFDIDASRWLDNMSRADVEMSYELKDGGDQLVDIMRRGLKSGLEMKGITQALKETKAGAWPDRFTPEQQEVLEATRNFFKDKLEYANANGIKITELDAEEGYVPLQLKKPDELFESFYRLKGDLEKRLGLDLTNQFDDAALRKLEVDTEGADFLNGLRVFSQQADITEPRYYHGVLSDIISGKMDDITNPNLSTLFGHALKREGDIPDFMLEDNIIKLAARYQYGLTSQVLKKDLLDEGILIQSKLEAIRDAAVKSAPEQKQASVRNSFDFWIDRIENMNKRARGLSESTGGKWDFAKKRAEMSSKARKWATKKMVDLEDDAPGWKRIMYRSMYNIPEVPNMATNWLRSNILGLSPKAIIEQVFQPLQLTMGEAAGGAEKLNFARNWLKNVVQTTSGGSKYNAVIKSRALAEELGKPLGSKVQMTQGQLAKNLGFKKQDISYRQRKALQDGMKAGMPGEAATFLTQDLSDAAMHLYGKADVFNKMVVLGQSADIAKRAVQDPDWLRNTYFKGMPKDYRRAVNRALESGDQDEVRDIMATYLNSKTIFNYDAESMSEFGKWAGPVLGMFSKLPSELIGDMGKAVMDKNWQRLGGKYALPLLMFAGADYAWDKGFEASGNEETGERVKKFVAGSRGFKGMAPGLMPFEMVWQGFNPEYEYSSRLIPPAAGTVLRAGDVGYNALKKIFSEDEEVTEEDLTRFVDSFTALVPGEAFLRFATYEIPTALGKDVEPSVKRKLSEQVGVIEEALN